MYTQVNPSFTIKKVGLKWVKFIYACFRDEFSYLVSLSQQSRSEQSASFETQSRYSEQL